MIGGDLNQPSHSLMDGHMQERQPSTTFQGNTLCEVKPSKLKLSVR